MKQFLQLIIKLIRLFKPDLFEPWAVMIKRGDGLQPIEQRILKPIEFQNEKQKIGGDAGERILGVAIKFSFDRIRGVTGINQPSIRDQAP